jgi:hypothetical protein
LLKKGLGLSFCCKAKEGKKKIYSNKLSKPSHKYPTTHVEQNLHPPNTQVLEQNPSHTQHPSSRTKYIQTASTQWREIERDRASEENPTSSEAAVCRYS